MAQIDYNRPNTRARIEARRKQLRQQGGKSERRRSSIVQRFNEYWQHRDSRRLHIPRRSAAEVAQGSRVVARPGRAAVGWLVSGRLFSLLLAAAALCALYYTFNSPQFRVRRITLHGGTMLNAEHVSRLADVQGQSIWFANPTLVAERLRADPFVEKVSVTFELPDTLRVTLVERQPELRWQIGGTQFLVDGRGTVLAAATEPDLTALVLVENGMRQLQPGDSVDPDALKLARQLALRLPGELNLTPALLGWDIALGVYVRTPSGQTVIFGQSANLERKLAILRYLLEDGTAFTLLDLRPETPFYRNDGAAPAPAAEAEAEDDPPVQP